MLDQDWGIISEGEAVAKDGGSLLIGTIQGIHIFRLY